jgi:protein-L-isoaspartate(D-aspartate) O-methyltransferase
VASARVFSIARASLRFVWPCRKKVSHPENGTIGVLMIDFAAARRMMVDGQVRTADVTDPRLIAAMFEVPRERFLPPATAALAYVDFDAPVTENSGKAARFLLKPMVLAKLIQAAEVKEGDAVLDVGCTTGYSSAVLSRLARSVVALEEDPSLSRRAEESVHALGIANVSVVAGPLTAGWPARAPYDVILLQGATEVEPRTLFAQLKEGGRLLCVNARAAGKAVIYRRAGGDVSGWPIFDATAAILPGFTETPAFVF